MNLQEKLSGFDTDYLESLLKDREYDVALMTSKIAITQDFIKELKAELKRRQDTVEYINYVD